MIRKKIKIQSWDLGRDFMNKMSSTLDLTIEEVDANLRMSSENIYVNCFFDDRNFSSILIKIYDESLTESVQEIIEEYK